MEHTVAIIIGLYEIKQSDNWKPKLPYFKSTNVSQVKLAMQYKANMFKHHL